MNRVLLRWVLAIDLVFWLILLALLLEMQP